MSNPLKIQREKQGLTQLQIADKLNKSKGIISRWERGIVIPNTIDLLAIVKAYRMSNEQLIQYLEFIANEKNK